VKRSPLAPGLKPVPSTSRSSSRADVTIEWLDGDRGGLAELFALADDSPDAVAQYRDRGRVLVAKHGSRIVGHAQLLPCRACDDAELKSLAVAEERQGEGIGRSLVEHAIASCRAAGYTRLVVAAAAAATGVLRFYQRAGFRMSHVERDVFTARNGYPEVDVEGIPLRDRVWLSIDL
jgi:GNAT superfamily N-acetyltransferase